MESYNESEKIELYFSCRNLPNLDLFSKTDAKVLLHLKGMNGNYTKIGETEIIYNNLNPDFSTSITVDYYFEIHQEFKVEVIDIDGKGTSNYEYVGSHEFTLGQIIGKNKAYYSDLMHHQKKRGYIIIRYDKICKQKYLYYFNISAYKLIDEGFFTKSKPFFKFYKYIGTSQIDCEYDAIAPNSWLLIYQTEYQTNFKSLTFKEIKINSSKLNNNDNTKPIKIEYLSHDKSGNHKTLGILYLTIQSIINGQKNYNISSIKNKNKHVGDLIVNNYKCEEDFDIVDYVRGGLQISTCIAIDFTASNKDPTDVTSLHYYNSESPYEKAIYGVTNILLNYDFDKQVV